MSFQIKKFSTIRLCSVNVRESAEWYKKFLQRDPIEDTENFVSFEVNGVSLEICRADEKSPSSVGGSIGYWLVDHLDDAVAKAIALGGALYRGPLRVEEVRRTIAQIKDPNGNVIGLEQAF